MIPEEVDKVGYLEDENKLLSEVRDDLLDENERLRGEIHMLKVKLGEVS